MAAINIRGTSGSGKSTLIRKVMSLYDVQEPVFREGRKQPIGYTCRYADRKPLYVVGHYETPCGGCDTINGVDRVYEMVWRALARLEHVIFEGLIIASDVNRAIELKDFDGMVLELDTDISTCIASIQSRRDARGDDRELDPSNTMKKQKLIAAQRVRFVESGIDFRLLSREDAYVACCQKLGIADLMERANAAGER